MPELPEVETVKRELKPLLEGKRLDTPIIYWKKAVHSPLEEYQTALKGKTITSVERRGKYILFYLDDGHKLLFHLRMEGKLYVVKKENHSLSHLSLFLPFMDTAEGLAFYDTRKFGVTYYLRNDEEGPLDKVGLEPYDIKDSNYLYQKYHSSSKMLKELLLDQSIMSGLGNIYANEVLYACKLSPFLSGKKTTKENCDHILKESIRILDTAIEHNGSTIRTYHAKDGMPGEFQNFLQVYSKHNKECPICHHKIEKRFVSGRGTEYCPVCQNTGLTIAITGKIASGKSLAVHYFGKEGFLTWSADECVHELYSDKTFLKELKEKFPIVFTPELDKKKIATLLSSDKVFKRKYLSLIFSKVKEKANSFIIHHNNKDKVLELPVLFDAHMQHDFSIIVGVETTRQIQHLKERGEDASRATFNKLNSYDKHHHEIDYILHTDGKKSELHAQVKELIKKLKA